MNNNHTIIFLIILTVAMFTTIYLQFYHTQDQISTEFQKIRKEWENPHRFRVIQDSTIVFSPREIPIGERELSDED